MPRSSRNKSSKIISKESRDFSDPEKDSSFKEKKGREDSNVSIRLSKESSSASGEKLRALDSKSSLDNIKDLTGPGKVESVVNYAPSSSKKRKEKVDADRWTGGNNDGREVLIDEMNAKDSKGSGESKSRSSSIVENSGLEVDGEGVKRSGSKVETKHHRSGRKERSDKEGGSERERNVRDSSKSDKLDGDAGANERGKDVGSEDRLTKHIGGNTESKLQGDLRTPDLERDSERRVKRKKDDSGDMNKHHREPLRDGRSHSKDDIYESGRYKDGVQKDGRGKDKYKVVVDNDGKHHDGKPRDRDGRHSRDYSHNRSNDRHLKTDKKDIDVQPKKYRPHDADCDNDNDRGQYSRDHHGHEREDREHDTDREKDQGRERGRGRDHGYERSRDIDRDRERTRDHNYHDRDKERTRDRDFTHERGRDWDHDHDRDCNSLAADRSSRYKDDRVRKRSPDGYDDYLNDNSRSAKVEAKADRDRAFSRGIHVDTMVGISRGRNSPNSRSHGGDKYRDYDDFRHGDSSREGAGNSETHDKVSKYRPADKRAKFDDNHLGDLSAERSPHTKVSGVGLIERSPSCTSADRKYVNLARSGRRQSQDADEADRRSCGSNDLRDDSVNEERRSRDLAPQKPFMEGHPQPESFLYQRSSQGPGAPGFRAGVDGPFMGSMGDDSRVLSSRYRRTLEPNFGRAHGNPWKGVPSWPPPLSNGFMPFPPGPHGGFPPIVQQFPSAPMFGVRPSLEMNHSGIPFMTDADRFSGPIRPIGWQHMVEGTGPSHFPGWNANNGAYRDESSMYGAGHQTNGRTRDTNSETMKPNGDVSVDEVSGPPKDGYVMKASMEESVGAQGIQGSCNGSDYVEVENKLLKTNTPIRSSLNKQTPVTPNVTAERTPDSSSANDTANLLHVYISKLDISIELAEPELYNQCINLGVEEHDGTASNDVIEHVHFKEITNATSEAHNPTMGITVFPAAEEDIFQRALDLYKTYCSGRRSLPTSNDGEERLLPLLASEEHLTDMDTYPVERVDGFVHIGDGETQEKLVLASDAGMELLPDADPEVKGSLPLGDEGCQNEGPLESPELVVQSPPIRNLIEEKIEYAISKPLEQNDVKERIDSSLEIPPEEVTCSKGIDLVTENGSSERDSCAEERLDGAIAVDGPSVWTDDSVKVCERNSCAEERLDGAIAVDGPSVLTDGSVKVCETSMSLSHESGLVILSRIHHAPESTH